MLIMMDIQLKMDLSSIAGKRIFTNEVVVFNNKQDI